MRPKIKPIELLPASDPFNKRVRACFRKAGFQSINLQQNADRSMLTFWLEPGTHPAFKSSRQAQAKLLRLLRDAGINLADDDIRVSLRGGTVFGAFTPPDWLPNPPA